MIQSLTYGRLESNVINAIYDDTCLEREIPVLVFFTTFFLNYIFNCRPFIIDENYDIALAMSSSRADPVLGHCPGWGYLNI